MDTPEHPSQPVLRFWLEDGLTLGWPSADLTPRWFGGGPALDTQITQAFGPLVQSAVQDGLSDWEDRPLHRLALVLLLDQFTRNVFRGQARAFAGDARARALVRRTLDGRPHRVVPTDGGTEVIWTMTGPKTFMTRVMGIFMSMDKMVGKDFDRGLASLKAVVEGGGPATETP